MLGGIGGQEEKGTTEDEMAGWHHWLNGREFEWTPGVGDGQGGLVCCDSWGRKESDTTERLNWTGVLGTKRWILSGEELGRESRFGSHLWRLAGISKGDHGGWGYSGKSEGLVPEWWTDTVLGPECVFSMGWVCFDCKKCQRLLAYWWRGSMPQIL